MNILTGAWPRVVADLPAAIAAGAIQSDTSGIPVVESVSIRQINQVLYGPAADLPDGQFRLLLYLADRAKEDGSDIYPDVDRLAAHGRKSKRWAQLFVKELTARGWMTSYVASGGFLRWRLQLPDRCGNPVENPVEKTWHDDRGIAFRDRRIADRDPGITSSHDLSLPFDNGLPAVVKRPPSLYPSLYPSRTEELPALIAPDSPPDADDDHDRAPRGGLSTTVRDRAARAPIGPVAPDECGRVEGPPQGLVHPDRLPRAAERDVLPGDGGGGAGASGDSAATVSAAPGAPLTPVCGGGRSQLLGEEADAPAGAGERVHAGPRAAAGVPGLEDLRAQLASVKARIESLPPFERRRRR